MKNPSLKGLVDYSQPLVAAATLLTLGLLVAAAIAASTAYRIKVSGDIIEVTGSAKESVTADFARWSIHLETKTGTGNQQEGLDRLERAKETIVAYLATQDLTDIETPIASVYANYSYPERAEPIHTGYTISRTITVRSAEVGRVSELAGNLTPLSGASYTVTTGNLELTYQKLDEKRVALLSGAIRDARARAEAIAEETGRSVGILRSATGGVVQVLPQGGIDISDYGTYDTQSVGKDIMVTVRARFSVE